MEGLYRVPSNYSVDAQHKIELRPVRDQADIFLDARCRGAFPVAGQTAGSYQSPESFGAAIPS